jgi:BNR repeat-like domain
MRLAPVAALLGIAVAGAVALTAPALAKPPSFAPPVQLPKAAGGDEPRIAIAPNDRRFVIANDAETGEAIVFASSDRGATWKRTKTTFPGQQGATIDTEIVATRSGRIVATELDDAGLTFITGYSDDGGRTWRSSTGTELADIDRPWMAVGPDDPSTHQPRVYLLFHNLFSGIGQHNMFVSTSRDGGASFDPPVPVTLPGSQAYLDLQCSDSGAPSSLNVNPRSGEVYAVWGTRTSKAGGCGASVFGTPEANVVGETRVWVARSTDGSAGSWTDSLAADAGDKTVSASFEPGAVDRAGNVYVAYAETAHRYPDFSQAAVKYVFAPHDLRSWSKPRIVAPAGPVGHYDPSMVAGERGELALAYYTGVPRSSGSPAWFVHAALVHRAAGASPRVEERRVSKIPAYAQSANAMGGSCAEGPVAGLENGLACDRATDDWGLALDARCRLTVVFPTVANSAPGARNGTFASTQRGGGTPCPGRARLAGRLQIGNLGGRADDQDERWRERGYVPLRARTTVGRASGATAVLYRVVHGHRSAIARTRKAVQLTTVRRTLRLYLVPGARVAAGRYVAVVGATIDGVRVRRERAFALR